MKMCLNKMSLFKPSGPQAQQSTAGSGILAKGGSKLSLGSRGDW